MRNEEHLYRQTFARIAELLLRVNEARGRPFSAAWQLALRGNRGPETRWGWRDSRATPSSPAVGNTTSQRGSPGPRSESGELLEEEASLAGAGTPVLAGAIPVHRALHRDRHAVGRLYEHPELLAGGQRQLGVLVESTN